MKTLLLLTGIGCAAIPDSLHISAHLDSLLRGKYLDMHCHAAGIGAGGSGCFLSHDIRSSFKYSLYLKAFGVTEEELKASGDTLVVSLIAAKLDSSQSVGAAVLLAMDGVIGPDGKLDTNRTQIFVPDSFVVRETRRYPRLLYGASINPARPDAISLLEKAKANGAVLLKWIPSIQLIDPGDSALIPFYLAMKRLGLPLLSHTGKESSFKTARNELGDPQRLRLPLKLGVTVIAAHVATRGRNEGEDNMERLCSMFTEYPNLYADISSLTQINKMGLLDKVLARPEVKGRLLYGTDYPLIQTALVSPYYFAFSQSLKKIREVDRIANPWDQDVALKKLLGVSEEVFQLPVKLLLAKGEETKGKLKSGKKLRPQKKKKKVRQPSF